MPPIKKLLEDSNNKWTATKFFMGEMVVVPSLSCDLCGSSVSFMKNPFKWEEKKDSKYVSTSRDCFKIHCSDRNCNYKQSVFKDSFFDGMKKTPSQMIVFFQLWLAKTDRTTIMGLLDWSEPTVLKFEAIIVRYRKLRVYFSPYFSI